MLSKGFLHYFARSTRNVSFVELLSRQNSTAAEKNKEKILGELWKVKSLQKCFSKLPEEQQPVAGGDGRHSVELYNKKANQSEKWYVKDLSTRKLAIISSNELRLNIRREYILSKLAELLLYGYTAEVQLVKDDIQNQIMIASKEIPGFRSLNDIAATHLEDGEKLQDLLWGKNNKGQTVIREENGQHAVVEGRVLLKYFRAILLGEQDRWKSIPNEYGLYGSYEQPSQREKNIGFASLSLRGNEFFAKLVGFDYDECGYFINDMNPEQLAFGRSSLEGYMPSLEFTGMPTWRRKRFREETFRLASERADDAKKIISSLDSVDEIVPELAYLTNNPYYEQVTKAEQNMVEGFLHRLSCFQEAHILSDEVRGYQRKFMENLELPKFSPDTSDGVVKEVEERFKEFEKIGPAQYQSNYTDVNKLPAWSIAYCKEKGFKL